MIKWINKKRNQKGFTLVELVVVIAILGILAALAIPRFSGSRKTANEGVIASNLRNIKSGVELYVAENNVADPTTINADDTGAGTGNANISGVLGAWPVGPGATKYTVVDGTPTATGVDVAMPDAGDLKQLNVSSGAYTLK